MTRKEYQENYYQSQKDDLKAARIVRKAVEEGLIKTGSCVDCGSVEKIIPWHDDPKNEPMNFEWVCKYCSRKRLKDIEDYINRLDKKFDERRKYTDFRQEQCTNDWRS